MALGDVYELVIEGTCQGQTADNVFHYEQDTEFVSTFPSPAHDLALGFENQVLPKMQAIATVDVEWSRITVRNLFNEGDAAVRLISETGAIGGGGVGADTLPVYNTFTYALTGDNPAVNQGRKAFSGVGELYQTDGVVLTESGFVGSLQDLADQMATPVKSEPLLLSDLFIPVIVKRVREGVAPNYTYRLPSTAGEKVVSRILVALWNLLVSTQMSRKFGVGS